MNWFTKCKRGAICLFFAVHVCATLWWVTPRDNYPTSPYEGPGHASIERIEKKIYELKRNWSQYSAAWAIEQYTFVTATWQNWAMFAPNPTNEQDWITVYAVTAWDRVRKGKKRDMVMRPWGNDRVAVYDPEPLYKSYVGDLDTRMKSTAKAYYDDSKLVENLISKRWNATVELFARYWGREYELKRDRPLLGVHIIRHHSDVPRIYAEKERMPSSDVVREDSILYYVNY